MSTTTKSTILEITNGDFTSKYMVKNDEALNLSTGVTITRKEFDRLLLRSQSKSSWNLITESNPLVGNEVSDNASIIYSDVTYDVDGKLYKFEMDIALEAETNSIFIVKYNTENETQHYANFDAIDGSLLAIVNNLDNANRKDDDSYMDKEMLLASIVATIETEYEELADDRAGYNTSAGVIYYDNQYESYRLQKLSKDKPKKSGNRRTRL